MGSSIGNVALHHHKVIIILKQQKFISFSIACELRVEYMICSLQSSTDS